MPNVSELAREEYDAEALPKRASPSPYLGMPATYVSGSDLYGGRLVAVSSSGRSVTWESEGGTWVRYFSRRKNGRYVRVGSKVGHLELGVAMTALDEGF
jgi:hypothetical protein